MAFKEWDIASSRRGGQPRLKDNEIAFSYDRNSHSYKIRINVTLSQKLREKGLLCMAVAQEDMTGEVAFIFRKDNGIMLKGENSQSSNLRIYHKDLSTRLARLFDLAEGATYYLELSPNKSIRDDVLFYIVTAKKE